MLIKNISTAKTPMQQASRLSPDIQVNTKPLDSFGSIATSRGYTSNARRMPSAFTAVFDNSGGGAPVMYGLGDPAGMVAAKFGLTLTAPTSITGLSVAAFQASLGYAPILIKGFNYESTDGKVQFSQRFQFADADLDRGQLIDLVVPQYVRNTANDPNLLTLAFDEGFELDWNAAFIIVAEAGERVVLTGMIGAAAGR